MTESTMTVQDMIDRIITEMGGPLDQTVDTVKAGDTAQPVRGVVTTFMATVPVIRRAAELGANVIFTHEPTFYNHLDDVSFLQNDPVYKAKARLLEESGIVVSRMHDYPHGLARSRDGGLGDPSQDPFMVGIVQAMGWQEYSDPQVPYCCTIPPIALSDLLQQFKQRLSLTSVRAVGDLNQQCTKVVLLLGAAGINFHVRALDQFDADVVTTGETPEWETFSYAADASELGIKRAVVALGHEPSEEPGMALLADWLRDRFPDVTITHVPSAHTVVSV